LPGNIREISNLIEQLVVLSSHDKIDLEDLPSYIRVERLNRNHSNPTQGWNLPEALENLEKAIIFRAMKTFGSQLKTAVPLGIDQSTLARKIKKHGILG
jgi:transcriptional regulator with PAS, ATPase and Fis domain